MMTSHTTLNDESKLPSLFDMERPRHTSHKLTEELINEEMDCVGMEQDEIDCVRRTPKSLRNLQSRQK